MIAAYDERRDGQTDQETILRHPFQVALDLVAAGPEPRRAFAVVAEELVGFYVARHNTVMPHREFNGRTPDEVYFGTATDLEDDLAVQRRQARAGRVVANRAAQCQTCEP